MWTDARLGLIGFIMTFVLSGLLYGIFWWRRQRQGLIGPALVLAYPALMVATFVSTLVVGRFRNKIWGGGQYDASNQGRIEMYEKGIPMVMHRPWGFGAGRGAETLGITNEDGVLTIDTYYMLIGLEYGVIGFIIYYGAFLLGTYVGGRAGVDVKDRRSEQMLLIPLTVALSNYVIIKAVFSNDDNHPLAFMMLGMVLALLVQFRREKAAAAAPVETEVVKPFPTAAKSRRGTRG
jgi:O-antigen ligase